MTHELKIKEPFADAIDNGDKMFEVRYNDRGYQRGDVIKFTVVDKIDVPIYSHPLTGAEFEITYVLNGWGIKDEYVVFGFRPLFRNVSIK